MQEEKEKIGWLRSVALVMKQEVKHILRDEAVIIFLWSLP